MKRGALTRDERGAVFVEHLIAYLPVIFFFLATWQLIELCAAQLIVQRAASAAVRAAIVVMPDDPALYLDARPPDPDCHDPKTADVILAAAMILGANPHLGKPKVKIDGTSGSSPTTVTVTAPFSCFAGWASLVCGVGGVRTLTARATHVFQGARYDYEP